MRSLDIPRAQPEQPKSAEKPPRDDDPFEIDELEVDELISLRQEVDKRLPIRSLRDINMEQELLLQLLTAQKLQRDVLSEEDVPANQRAQTMNAVAASLQVLAKLQTEVHTSERLKRIERALIESIETTPAEVQEAFFRHYEAALAKL